MVLVWSSLLQADSAGVQVCRGCQRPPSVARVCHWGRRYGGGLGAVGEAVVGFLGRAQAPPSWWRGGRRGFFFFNIDNDATEPPCRVVPRCGLGRLMSSAASEC